MSKIKSLVVMVSMLTLNSCFSQECKSLLGNVYSYEGSCKRTQVSHINGFRIEEVSKDSLYIRFSLDKETFIGVSMFYNQKLKEYCSKKNIPSFSTNERIILIMQDSNTFFLGIQKSSEEFKSKIFTFKYKDSIIKNHIRDPYYAEDGFSLCNK